VRSASRLSRSSQNASAIIPSTLRELPFGSKQKHGETWEKRGETSRPLAGEFSIRLERLFVVMGLKDRCLRSLRASIWKTSEGWPPGGIYGASWHKPLTTNDLIQTSLRTRNPWRINEACRLRRLRPSAVGRAPSPSGAAPARRGSWSSDHHSNLQNERANCSGELDLFILCAPTFPRRALCAKRA
jgi:hypothetical protein